MIKATVHEETRGQWKTTKPCNSPHIITTARRPDNIPLICTGAGPIHPVHSQPMSLATEAMPETRLHFCHFPAVFFLVWQTWAYSLEFVRLACWHTDVSRWSGGQPWRSSSFHYKKHCWCSHTCLSVNFQCSHRVTKIVSHALWHNLQLTSDRRLIFASHLATRMVLAIAIISRLLCLQGTCGLFKYFPKNTLLSFCRNDDDCFNMKWVIWSGPITCYMQGDWYFLALP